MRDAKRGTRLTGFDKDGMGGCGDEGMHCSKSERVRDWCVVVRCGAYVVM